MLLLRKPELQPAPLAVLVVLALSRLAAADETEAPPASSSAAAFGVANNLVSALSAAAEVASAASAQSAASVSRAASEGPSGSATATATAAWATSTAGGMEQYTDSNDTVVLHDDLSVTYSCPTAGDEWVVEQLTDSLSAHTATGAGCTVEYAFQGDAVQIYGATGTEGGVFGCSVTASGRNFTGWWNGRGTSNTFQPYQGSCSMQGLGWDGHTVQLVNSPYQPGKVWFTGLRFSTNKTQSPWETHAWDTCCAAYTFPEGVATTVDAAPTSGASSGGAVAGMSSGTTMFVVVGLAAVVILASLLIACMCCSKRPAAGGPGTKAALRAALHSPSSTDDEARPLKRKKSRSKPTSRRRRRQPSTDTSESSDAPSATTSTASETDVSDEEKGQDRASRRKKQ
ncbi:hypothetical protein JCM8208_005167 [Rhodotorula glutinis]